MANSGTGYARRVIPVILCNGAEVNLSQNLLSLRYTDNASGSIDDIKLTIADREGNWSGWNPQKEDDLDVTISMFNWESDGDTKTYHCGNFTLDDISYKGSPKTLSIGAVSQPASSSFKGGWVTKTWQKVTIKQIAMEIMAKYGMPKLYYWGNEYLIDTIEQDNQSDSEFLQQLCESYGFALKIYKKGLVIFDEALYESRGTARTFYPEDIEPGYEWNTTLQGTYTGAQISYTNGKQGQDITITVGTAERLMIMNEKADTQAEAETKARSAVNNANKSAVTMTFTLQLADPDIVASCNIQLEGFHQRINGKYYVDKVVNNISSSGYTMQVTCHKIMGRI